MKVRIAYTLVAGLVPRATDFAKWVEPPIEFRWPTFVPWNRPYDWRLDGE
jgi:hypothetical protein